MALCMRYFNHQHQNDSTGEKYSSQNPLTSVKLGRRRIYMFSIVTDLSQHGQLECGETAGFFLERHNPYSVTVNVVVPLHNLLTNRYGC